MNNPGEKPLRLRGVGPAFDGPLYQQIVDAIRREIREGNLAAGDGLPSFRGLAEQLLVSVITVKRAYEELERDGVIFRRQGLGTFVAPKAEREVLRAEQSRAEEQLRQAVRDGLAAGMSPEELEHTFQQALGRAARRRKRA